MAEAATASTPRQNCDAARGSNPAPNVSKSQKSGDIWLNANPQQQPGPSTSRSGWRVPTGQVAARPSPPTTPSKEPAASTPGSGTSSGSRFPPPSTPRRSSGPGPATLGTPGLGPVITPTRQTSSPSASGSSGIIRRASYVQFVLTAF